MENRCEGTKERGCQMSLFFKNPIQSAHQLSSVFDISVEYETLGLTCVSRRLLLDKQRAPLCLRPDTRTPARCRVILGQVKRPDVLLYADKKEEAKHSVCRIERKQEKKQQSFYFSVAALLNHRQKGGMSRLSLSDVLLPPEQQFDKQALMLRRVWRRNTLKCLFLSLSAP